MSKDQQLNLFDLSLLSSISEPDNEKPNWGTFQDSLRAPIHSWFVYPTGFSYKAVEDTLAKYAIDAGQTIFDPFAGTGTTNLAAAQLGIHSYGIEAHPFIHFVAETKLEWDFEFDELTFNIRSLIDEINHEIYMFSSIDSAEIVAQFYPELVQKCFTAEKLSVLHCCRSVILRIPTLKWKNFAKLALTYMLRSVADVETGWPYIAPKKARKPKTSVDVVDRLQTHLLKMANDLRLVKMSSRPFGNAHIFSGDARQTQPLEAKSIDFAFTSPPYLNNFDYADRTRLEMYFWGEASTWGDITKRVRTRLMMSATTQINRKSYDMQALFSDDLCSASSKVSEELRAKVQQLSALRLHKGGKKSYDIMVAGYFNDMTQVLYQTYQLLNPNTSCVLVLGDSAPYGVYIPTHEYLAAIGLGVGFSSFHIQLLRTRGGKWKDNPQRHHVALQECLLTLHKS